VQDDLVGKLGKTQARILEFLAASIRGGNVCPSFQEIADAVGLGTVSTVNYHLKILERLGHISRPPGHARSIQLNQSNCDPQTAAHLTSDHLGDRIYLDGWRTLLGVGSIRHQYGTLVSLHTSTPSGEPENHARLLAPESPIQYEPKAS